MPHAYRYSLLAACSLAAALAATAPDLRAAETKAKPEDNASAPGYPGWGYGMGPGMMGGYGYGMGPGMMGGYGMGPGMMGGYGMGPGMMGGYGMGPGMMGGYGMGPGMMGGYGMGPGGGGYWARHLKLSDEQQAKINKIQDDTRKQHWSIMGAMMDQQAKLRDLYAAPNRDSAAIDETYKNIGTLQQQMYDSGVDARKRIEAVLTKEQQERLRKDWRGGWGY
jgi:Spy/CpxP family protein refolding chaperone